MVLTTQSCFKFLMDEDTKQDYKDQLNSQTFAAYMTKCNYPSYVKTSTNQEKD